MRTRKNHSEYQHFNNLSEEWWDENGKFKVLHQIRPLRIEYILKQLTHFDLKSIDILDVGCGGGLVCESLSRLGSKITGVDFVENNIRVAKKHAKEKKLKIDYIHQNIEKMSIKRKYDVIIMFEILEHLNDWNKFLNNIKKNLKSKGVIIISTINRNIISKVFAINIAENILKWIPKGTHSYEKFIKPNEIKLNMLNSNFKFNDLTGLVFNPINSSWTLSSNTSVNYFCCFTKIS